MVSNNSKFCTCTCTFSVSCPMDSASTSTVACFTYTCRVCGRDRNGEYPATNISCVPAMEEMPEIEKIPENIPRRSKKHYCVPQRNTSFMKKGGFFFHRQ